MADPCMNCRGSRIDGMSRSSCFERYWLWLIKLITWHSCSPSTAYVYSLESKWWRLGQFLFYAAESDVWAALNGCCGFLALSVSSPRPPWARPSNTVFSIISKSCVNHLLVRSRIFKDVSGAVILLVSTVTCLWWRSSHERNRRLVFP